MSFSKFLVINIDSFSFISFSSFIFLANLNPLLFVFVAKLLTIEHVFPVQSSIFVSNGKFLITVALIDIILYCSLLKLKL